MRRTIAVLGSSNTDMIIKVNHLPKPGETILGGEFLTAAGGKGANQAVGAARAGGDVTFIARVGKDIFGDSAVRGFQDAGLRLEFVTRDPRAPSGVALIFVAKSGENSIAVASGANGRLSPADVRRARKAITSASVLVMQLETPLPTIRAATALACAAGVKVVLNPAPARELPAKLLSRISVLTPNETEAELLTGVQVKTDAGAAKAAEVLLGRGVETVIITLGARGAFVASGDLRQRVAGFKVKAVDTTAAGDIFNGALAVALAEKKTILEAVRFANAAAALSVTRIGAQPSAPTRKEIERLARSARHD